MDIKEILAATEHTLLSPSAVWLDVKRVCDEAVKYKAAAVCIPPCFVKKAAEYVRGRVKICTVAGFPHGNACTEAKCFEAERAERDGANEISMVINIGMVKEKRYADVLAEINAVSDYCRYSTLKAIVETCLLTQEEKVKLCDVVSASRAQYIETSTGFSAGGATVGDTELLAKNMRGLTLVKAAGGIESLEEAEALLTAGAHRIGSEKIVKIAKQIEYKEKLNGGK